MYILLYCSQSQCFFYVIVTFCICLSVTAGNAHHPSLLGYHTLILLYVGFWPTVYLLLVPRKERHATYRNWREKSRPFKLKQQLSLRSSLYSRFGSSVSHEKRTPISVGYLTYHDRLNRMSWLVVLVYH